MATSVTEDQVYIEVANTARAVAVASSEYVALAHDENILVNGQRTDLFSVTLEPRSDVAVAETLSTPVVLLAGTTVVLTETGGQGPPGPGGPPGPQGIPGPPGIGVGTFLVQRIPLETPDQIRTSFTAPDPYLAGSLIVTLNGLENPVAETAPDIFTFSAAPHAGDLILLRYQTA